MSPPSDPVPALDDYRLLVEHSPDLLTRHSADGTFLYASPACTALTGYTPPELIGMNIYGFLHPMDFQKVRKAYANLSGSPESHVENYRLRHKDGYYVWLETTLKLLIHKGNSSSQRQVLAFSRNAARVKQIEDVLQILARRQEYDTSEDFFRVLISHVTAALRVKFAFITESLSQSNSVRMLAFWQGDGFGTPYEYPLPNTPCASVINEGKTCYYPIGVRGVFPKDQDLVTLNAQGYLGIPIHGVDGTVLGHIAVLDDKPLKISDLDMWILKIFAAHAADELERTRKQ